MPGSIDQCPEAGELVLIQAQRRDHPVLNLDHGLLFDVVILRSLERRRCCVRAHDPDVVADQRRNRLLLIGSKAQLVAPVFPDLRDQFVSGISR